ncbi:MAG: family transposase, partial [Pedosphaera sp.]|nr:family transposase [Pedosphaera sp.]
MEEGLCGDGSIGYPQAQSHPGGEHAVEEAGGRSGLEDLALGGGELKKVVSPAARRRAARYLVTGRKCSARQACQTLGLARSTFYRPVAVNQRAERLARRIRALSRQHPRYGYRLITQLLRREGWAVNRKRVQRVRRQAGLQVVRKSRKTRRPRGPQAERARAARPHEVWSYDFIHDRLENGVGVKMLTVLDEFSRECLGILVARSITAAGVIGFLEMLILKHGAPENARSDNGPEFVVAAVQQWAAQAAIQIHYIAPGSPWENGQVESFHGKLRDG